MNALINYLRKHSIPLFLGVFAMALYAPAKDLLSYTNKSFAAANIELASISFGAHSPWAATANQSGFVKASQSLNTPQQIFTKITLKNPSNESVLYRKLWLYFEHDDGKREYTTDYTLYDPETRQRLIGHSIELGPNSEISVLASYRFIPSYQQSEPETVSISWEDNKRLRSNSCEYELSTGSLSQFGATCR
ncbi:hypothetical protein DN730_01080 [Marinomonas piezotolerans]|uniref:Cutinase n=1 Tax=Marinomonas piezotolerans TaxID=2213058 RepID=A0A370UD11_9GAMM|nr:hypothetical protein [Marinomonas piezotolerans]RDL45676.1 hypothetical protein DN730_01080 [Marinomonas piezotolerans]